MKPYCCSTLIRICWNAFLVGCDGADAIPPATVTSVAIQNASRAVPREPEAANPVHVSFVWAILAFSLIGMKQVMV